MIEKLVLLQCTKTWAELPRNHRDIHDGPSTDDLTHLKLRCLLTA